MKAFPSGRLTPEQAKALARADRNKIIVMSVLGLLLAVAFFTTRGIVTKREAAATTEGQNDILGRPDELVESVTIPQFDRPDLLAGVRDERPDDRVLEDPEALEAALTYAYLFNWRHYAELEVRDLDAAARAELEADLNANRLAPYRVRGWVTRLQPRARKSGVAEWAGSLRLEDGQSAHFVVRDVPQQTELESFVMLEGLFLKLYRSEIAGRWEEGPLLVGAALTSSYPAAEPAIGTEALLESVRDDELDSISGEPTAAYWELVRLAAQPKDQAFWDAAEEINSELLNKIFLNGDEYRGKAFRFPVCINVGSWVQRAPENPARANSLTEGWIGNMIWKGHAKAVWFRAPGARHELEDFQHTARYVTARGYFLKNRIYETRTGRPERVPFFVMEDVSAFIPANDESSKTLLAAFVGGISLLIVALFVLVFRDRRKTRELQAELVRRRRSRRTGVSLAGGAAADTM